jgi:toxin ParE1/3/4
MARYRLAPLAQSDLEQILATSATRWGPERSLRYAVLLYAGTQSVANNPERPSTRKCDALWLGLRSFHIRHVRPATVKRPAHIVYYRAIRPGLVEVVRILHERMDPSLHLSADDIDEG